MQYPIIEQVNEREYVLIKDYKIGNYIIKEGFKYDGASIPHFFWFIIGSPFTGKYTIAALVHDALYASEFYPRKICDKIFEKLMKECNVSLWKRKLMYWSVRIFGGFVWEKHNPEEVENNKKFIEVEVKKDA